MSKNEVASRVLRILAFVAFVLAILIFPERTDVLVIAYLLLSTAYLLKE